MTTRSRTSQRSRLPSRLAGVLGVVLLLLLTAAPAVAETDLGEVHLRSTRKPDASFILFDRTLHPYLQPGERHYAHSTAPKPLAKLLTDIVVNDLHKRAEGELYFRVSIYACFWQKGDCDPDEINDEDRLRFDLYYDFEE